MLRGVEIKFIGAYIKVLVYDVIVDDGKKHQRIRVVYEGWSYDEAKRVAKLYGDGE